ncbi:MAG: NAD(P)H-dependent oxidoreductase subunit E, partial [Firmicutes bacterium]|nr:NAD(P)H-dependent oxidoreductase subunit E [Bacillota bacterium]
MKITNRAELIKCREDALALLKSQTKKIYVCGGTGCVAGGSMEIYEELKRIAEEKGLACQISIEEDACGGKEGIGFKKSGCHGFCEMGPVLRIEPAKLFYLKVKPEDCEEIVAKSIAGDEVVDRLIYSRDDIKYPVQEEIPFYKHQTRIVLEDCGQIDAESVREYIAYGGYSSLEKCLFDMDRDDIVKTISDSNLRGRGGGGFPAGRKWTQV